MLRFGHVLLGSLCVLSVLSLGTACLGVAATISGEAPVVSSYSIAVIAIAALSTIIQVIVTGLYYHYQYKQSKRARSTIDIDMDPLKDNVFQTSAQSHLHNELKEAPKGTLEASIQSLKAALEARSSDCHVLEQASHGLECKLREALDDAALVRARIEDLEHESRSWDPHCAPVNTPEWKERRLQVLARVAKVRLTYCTAHMGIKVESDHGVNKGVRVITVLNDKSSFRAGIEVGDTIVSVDNVRVSTEKQFKHQLKTLTTGNIAEFHIIDKYRVERQVYALVGAEEYSMDIVERYRRLQRNEATFDDLLDVEGWCDPNKQLIHKKARQHRR